MGISEDTVEKQVSKGVRALALALQATGLGSDAKAAAAQASQRRGRTTQ